MIDNPTGRRAATPQITIEGSTIAPFIYFDGVATLGHWNGIMQIELAANAVVPDGAVTKTEVVVVAHLRCTLSGLGTLKDAIQKIETMLAPPEGQGNLN